MQMNDSKIDNAAHVTERMLSIGLAPAIDLTNGVLAVMKLHPEGKGAPMLLLGAAAYCRALAGAATVELRISAALGIVVPGILAIDATPEKFKLITNTLIALFAGVVVSKAPATAIVFSAGHIITANKCGAILIQMDSSGVVTTKVSAPTQAYSTVAAAVAALPAPDANKLAISNIQIANNAGDWTANTDDMTNGSDVTTATFNNVAARVPLSGAITPVAGDEVPGTIVPASARLAADEFLVILSTTNHTGVLTDGRLGLHYRARDYRGD